MGGRRGKAKARESPCLATVAKCLSTHRFFERLPALRARQARQECRKSTISGPNSRDSRPQRRAAMSDDDEFTPRLGRQRQQGGKRARRYLGRVVGAAIRSAEKGSVRSRRFDGSRIGHGASMGRLLSSRDRFGGLRARRAVVKTRLVRIGTKGMPAVRAHLRYIPRDGVPREGTPGELYSADRDKIGRASCRERV